MKMPWEEPARYRGTSFDNQLFPNPYRPLGNRSNETIRDNFTNHLLHRDEIEGPELPGKRSFLSRAFDVLLTPNYAVAGFFDGIADGKGGRTPIQGFVDGIRGGNPFGEAYTQGQTTFSDVLDTAGWQPESGWGKFARGAVGFALDVGLDPTTYLTGGASALIKGTGRTGKAVSALRVAGDTASKSQAFNKRYSELISAGSTRENAVKLADEFANQIGSSSSKVTHMTPEMAESIITARSIRAGDDVVGAMSVGDKVRPLSDSGDYLTKDPVSIIDIQTMDGAKFYRVEGTNTYFPESQIKAMSRGASEDVKLEAIRFSDRYNKLLGIRDVDGPGRITWGIGNMPFAPKSWRKHVVDLGSAGGARRVSDRLGISSLYGGLRSSIYGSYVGKLFSSNAPLYKLAHEDPEQLWNTMDYVAKVRGLKMDKISEEHAIREFVSNLDFTESESKEIIRALEDKTVWGQIRKLQVRFSKKSEENIRDEIVRRRNKTMKDIEEVEGLKNRYEKLVSETDDRLKVSNDTLSKLRNDYEKSLSELELEHLTEKEDLEKAIKLYQDEISSVGAETIAKAEPDVVTPESISDLYESVLLERAKTEGAVDARRRFASRSVIGRNVPSGESTIGPFPGEVATVREADSVAIENLNTDAVKRLGDQLERIFTGDLSSEYLADQVFKTNPNRAVRKSETATSRETRDIIESMSSESELKRLDEISERWERVYVRDALTEDVPRSSYRAGTKSPSRDVNLTKAERESLEGHARDIRNDVNFEETIGHSTRESSYKISEMISEHVYGDPTELGQLTDSAIDKLVGLIREGRSPNYIQKVIREDHYTFSTNARDINSIVARYLGYGRWSKAFDEPLEMIIESAGGKEANRALKTVNERFKESGVRPTARERKLETAMELVRSDKIGSQYRRAVRGDLANLYRLNKRRESIRKRLFSLDEKELKSAMSEMENEILLRDMDNVLDSDGYLTLKREDFIRDEDHFAPRSHLRHSDAEEQFELYPRRRTEGWDGELAQSTELGHARDHSDLVDDLKNFKLIRANANLLEGGDYMNRLLRELEYSSDYTYGKNYFELTDGQRYHVLKESVDNLTITPKRTRTGKWILVQRGAPRKQVGSDGTHRWANSYERAVPNRFDSEKEAHDFIKRMQSEERVANRAGQSGRLLDESISTKEIDRIIDTPPDLPPRVIGEDLEGKASVILKSLKDAEKQLESLGSKFSQSRQEIITEYEKNINNASKHVEELSRRREELVSELSKYSPDSDKLLELYDRYENYERIIQNEDAFDTWVQRKSEELLDVAEVVGAEELIDPTNISFIGNASSDKVRDAIVALRKNFIDIGLSEVGIDKLTNEQFMANVLSYVPRIATEFGEEYLRGLRNVPRGVPGSLTQDFGYGLKFNPHAKSRTIKGSGIEEINRAFDKALKGKNLFSENIAEIYLNRATKNTELLYDDKVMRTMLDTFGMDIPSDGVIEEGYKAVMNYGMMRETVSDMASMKLSMHISDAVGNYLRDNSARITNMAKKSGMDRAEFADKMVDNFLKENFSDEAMNKLWNNYNDSIAGGSSLPLDKMHEKALPMVELNPEQVKGIKSSWDEVYKEYSNHLTRQLSGAQKRGNQKRINEIGARIEKLSNSRPPQIKQVNDTIVHEANKARQIQRSKDQSAFLQAYDKFLHFMKMQQTVVLPAFHTRNKLSNIFNSWLVTGSDTFNWSWQKASTKLSFMDGDRTKLRKFLEDNPKWRETFKPVNIENPHPSLKKAVNMKDNNLSWEDAYDLALQYGVIKRGQFARDLGAGTTSKGMFKKLRFSRRDGRTVSFDPTDTENFVLYDVGTKIGSRTEASDRLINFMSSLRQGKSVEEAMDISNKALFDYSDITMFEETVMKRILPYYTWLRKNARLQVSQVVESPDKFRDLAKAINGLESGRDEDELEDVFLSDWARDWIKTPFSITSKDGRERELLLSANLPYMDISRLPDPTNPLQSARELLAQTAPQIKLPFEFATNYNTFFDNSIAKEGESKTLAYVQHALSQLGLVNVATGFNKDTAGEALLHASNSLTGVKMSAYDYERSKHMIMDDMRDNPEKYSGSEVSRLVSRIAGALTGSVSEWDGKYLLDNETKLYNHSTSDPDTYSGALIPISNEEYESLPLDEKEKYIPPTNDEVESYKSEAEAITERESPGSAIAKGYTWVLLDKTGEVVTDEPSGDIRSGFVYNVVDGDTIDIRVDEEELRLRLLLVDTPETQGKWADEPMPYGEEATEYAREHLLEKNAKIHVYGEDKYGRTLAFVETESGDDFNKGLIEQGLGRVRFTYDNFPDTSSQYPRTDDYFDAQRKAYESGTGIWSIPGYGGNPEVDEDFNMRSLSDYLNR